MRPTSWIAAICSRKTSTPCASMAAKVIPSLPGAPSFFLASAYASAQCPSLQTWTYRPQNHQDVSSLALTYILRLRSSKSMDALSSRPCLPYGRRRYKQQGPLAPRTLLRFAATTDPTATLSPSIDFPVAPVSRSSPAAAISRRGEEGFSSSSACPCHRAVASRPAEVKEPLRWDFGSPCCLHPPDVGLGLLGYAPFEATFAFLLSLRPGGSSSSRGRRCR